MAIVQPSNSDTLGADNHGLMHRVYSIDSASPAESVNVDASGNVGIGTITPLGILDITSTTSGFLPPRVTTTQKSAITAIAGMIVYDSTLNRPCFYDGSNWNTL